MTIEFQVIGLEKLQKEIKRVGKEGANKAAKEGTRKAAIMMRNEMRTAAPEKTGLLKRYIKHSVKRGRKFDGFNAKVGILNIKKMRKWNYAGAPPWPFYAYFIEKGTRRGKDPYRIPNEFMGRGRRRKKNKWAKGVTIGGKVFKSVRHPGIEPQPYIQPTFDRHRGRAGALAIRTMNAELRKYLK